MTVNRRTFVQQTAGAAASTLFAATFGARGASAAGCAQLPGVQLYTVRELLQHDARSALVALSARGLKELELFGLDDGDGARLFGMTPREFKTAVDGNGLSVPSAHIGGALTDTATISARANALGIPTVIVSLAPEFTEEREGRSTMAGATSLEQLDRLAERLNRAGREFRANGLNFGYHNHHVEFLPVDDRVAYDYLMANTDSDLVRIELDVGWVALAGVDVIDTLSRYGRRVIACHLKDFAPPRGRGRDQQAPQEQLVEPGAGTIDFARVLETMDEIGVAHGFIEIDVTDDPLGAVDRGHRYLQGLRAC